MPEQTFSEEVTIDKNNLDEEWERQASLVMKCAIEHADAIFDRDKIKESIEFTKAELDSAIRKNPEKYELTKITEGAVSAAINKHPDFLDLQESLHNANRTVNVMAGARSAFENKKKALEKMTDLYLSGYWAEPRVRTEAKDKFADDAGDRSKEEHQSVASGRIKSRLKKRS